MVIGIDGNEANIEKKVGIGEYAFELLKHFKDLGFKIQDLRFQIYLKDKPRPEMPEESENWRYSIVKPRKLWTQIGLPLYLFAHSPRPDVFFSPSHYAPRFAPVKTAIAIMDLAFLRFPELFTKKDLFQLESWTRYSAKNASKVFTISEASKNDILKAYQKSPEDVIVTYPGIRQVESEKVKMKNLEEVRKKYGIFQNYVLFVGTLQPRKNIERLIEAYSLIINKNPHPNPLPGKHGEGDHGSNSKELQLVIVGKKGWQYENILAAPDKYGVKALVRFLDFVPTEDLSSLYTHALCYVLPSLYEGFGLPVLEAMKHGCPVITSNVSSLPEAGGDAALYVDPENVKDIAEKIQRVIGNEKLREEMRKKGYAHIKKFSWEKTARETLEVLQELGSNTSSLQTK